MNATTQITASQVALLESLAEQLERSSWELHGIVADYEYEIGGYSAATRPDTVPRSGSAQ